MNSIKLCECGCGQAVKNRFVSGHNRKGKIGGMNGKTHSKETKVKLSIANKGRKFSEEHKEKISKSKKGRVPWNKGKNLDREICNKISKTLTGRKLSREICNKISKTLTGRKLSRAHAQKISISNKGKKFSKEVMQKMSDSHKGIKHSLVRKKVRSIAQKKLWQDPEYIRMMSNTQREVMIDFWKNLSNKEQRLKDMSRGLHIYPNKPETIILNLLNEMYPNEWKYTGDFSMIIAGKCPDFININGQKKIIELFGDYWHKNEDPQDRIDIFTPYGYDTLVIWERELNDIEKVKFKISEFHNNKGKSGIRSTR